MWHKTHWGHVIHFLVCLRNAQGRYINRIFTQAHPNKMPIVSLHRGAGTRPPTSSSGMSRPTDGKSVQYGRIKHCLDSNNADAVLDGQTHMDRTYRENAKAFLRRNWISVCTEILLWSKLVPHIQICKLKP